MKALMSTSSLIEVSSGKFRSLCGSVSISSLGNLSLGNLSRPSSPFAVLTAAPHSSSPFTLHPPHSLLCGRLTLWLATGTPFPPHSLQCGWIPNSLCIWPLQRNNQSKVHLVTTVRPRPSFIYINNYLPAVILIHLSSYSFVAGCGWAFDCYLRLEHPLSSSLAERLEPSKCAAPSAAL